MSVLFSKIRLWALRLDAAPGRRSSRLKGFKAHLKSKLPLIALFVAGLLVSFYYLNLFYSQNGGMRLSYRSTNWLFLIAALIFQLIGHGLRAYKSKLLLDDVRPIGSATLFKALSVGFLFNTVLPFRAGEFIRAHMIGRSITISRTFVFITILAERAIDGLILTALSASGWLAFRQSHELISPDFIKLIYFIAAASVTILFVVYLFYRQNRQLLKVIHSLSSLLNTSLRDKLRFIVWSIIYGTHRVFKLKNLLPYFFLSLLMWSCYICSAVMAVWFAYPLLDQFAALIAAVGSYLSVSVPSGPAYLGSFHYFYSKTVQPLGIPAGDLLTLSSTMWAILMLPVSSVGLLLLLLGRNRVKTTTTDKLDTLKNKLYRDVDITPEMSHFLDAYFAGLEINKVLSLHELKDRFKVVRTFKGGSNALTLLAWTDNGLVVRKITLPQYREKLRAQYQWLKERQDLERLPQLLGEEEHSDYYSFDIEYREDCITFFDFIHSETAERSIGVLDEVLDFANSSIYQPRAPLNAEAQLREYIKTKALGKIGDTAALSSTITNLLIYPTITINGERFDNFEQVIGKIKANQKAMAELARFSDGPIHGDLTVDNLIVSRQQNDFVLLDPNNENSVSDPVVDMAKLYQSLHSGYEFLCQLSKIELTGNTINFEENVSSKYSELYKHLDQRLKRELPAGSYRSLLFHEAMHYCRMLTYRAQINPETLPAFYAVAVRLFNQYLRQYE